MHTDTISATSSSCISQGQLPSTRCMTGTPTVSLVRISGRHCGTCISLRVVCISRAKLPMQPSFQVANDEALEPAARSGHNTCLPEWLQAFIPQSGHAIHVPLFFTIMSGWCKEHFGRMRTAKHVCSSIYSHKEECFGKCTAYWSFLMAAYLSV